MGANIEDKRKQILVFSILWILFWEKLKIPTIIIHGEGTVEVQRKPKLFVMIALRYFLMNNESQLRRIIVSDRNYSQILLENNQHCMTGDVDNIHRPWKSFVCINLFNAWR